MNKDKDIIENNLDIDISNQFNGILGNLSTFKTQITSLQNQLRVLEKHIKKQVKTLNKEAVKNKHKGNRKPSGFAKPSQISTALCSFMNKDSGTEVARTEVTQYIISYIKDHNLQNPLNRKIIEPDNELKNLLGVNDEEEITFFNLQKHMNKHFNTNFNVEEL